MGRIHKLDPAQVVGIAAGEVVERPASVLKELLENSLDAQATSISITLHKGGLDLIRVIDDGSGMDSDDARMCFEHHATSKLTSCEQLPEITTLGFRGEALSSIACVSDVTLITRLAAEHSGTKVSTSYAQEFTQQVCAAAQGTDITVQKLFERLPARKKFLKSTSAQWRACLQLIQAFCCAYPNHRWHIMHDDTLIYSFAQQQTLQDRLIAIWGIEYKDHLLPVDIQAPYAHITGFVASHQKYKADRSGIMLFVNNRWVKNQKLVSALIRGYKGSLPPDRFPCASIHIQVPIHEVDNNVHPRKEEVALLHSRLIESLLYNTITKLLNDQVQKNLALSHPAVTPTYNTPTWAPTPTFASFHTPAATRHVDYQAPYTIAQQHVPDIPNQTIPQQQALIHHDYTLIGQLHTTYILIENSTGLLLIDQHAAHEAVLYAQFSTQTAGLARAPLLFPLMCTLKQEDIDLLEQHTQLFLKVGIEFTAAGKNSLAITHTPVAISTLDPQEYMKRMLLTLQEESPPMHQEPTHAFYALMACKAAVKAGDTLNNQEMHELVQKLHNTPQRLTCPHGRPTTWSISLADLERTFKRVVST